MLTVAPKEMTRRYLEAFASGDVPAFDHLFQDDVDFSAPGLVSRDLDDIKAWHRRLPDAFPDLDTSITLQITTPSIAVTEFVMSGTHDAPLVTRDGLVPATRRSVTLRAYVSLRVDGELISSHHLLFDQLELLTQLGLVPAQLTT